MSMVPRIGDTAKLESSGPVKTVIRETRAGQEWFCQWIDSHGHLQGENCPGAAIEPRAPVTGVGQEQAR